MVATFDVRAFSVAVATVRSSKSHRTVGRVVFCAGMSCTVTVGTDVVFSSAPTCAMEIVGGVAPRNAPRAQIAAASTAAWVHAASPGRRPYVGKAKVFQAVVNGKVTSGLRSSRPDTVVARLATKLHPARFALARTDPTTARMTSPAGTVAVVRSRICTDCPGRLAMNVASLASARTAGEAPPVAAHLAPRIEVCTDAVSQ